MDRPASPLLSECSCVSLIGMAGSGKSTLGRLLARDLGWAHVDTDHLLEAHFGALLPELLREKGLDGFLEAEGRIVADIKLCRTVISTGGSVVYSAPAVARLRLLGPIVYLRISLETFLRRLGDEGRRGFVRRPSMSLEEVYAQRRPLYESAADIILDTDADGPEACLARLREWLSP
ncbi:MAG: homoserine kinase [Desulfovibrionaceae bacterium]